MHRSGTPSAQQIIPVDSPASGSCGAEVDAMSLEASCAGIEDNPVHRVVSSENEKGERK